jgi:hypothetical protein
VKDKLIVEFEKHPAGKTPTGEESPTPFVVVNYDFVLAKSIVRSNGALVAGGAAVASNGRK